MRTTGRLCWLLLGAVGYAQDWQALFDGKSFEHWDKRSDLWRIENGAIATNPSSTFRRGDLLTRESFRDFELEFEWKVARGANGGVKYRLQGAYDFRSGVGSADTAADVLIDPSFAGPKPVSVIGFEYQMADDENTPDAKRGARWSAGALYQFEPARKSRPARGDQFHRGRIVVRGMHVEHWLDGEKVVETSLDTPGLIWAEPGTYRAAITGMLLAHRNWESPIALQYHNSQARYRSIRVRRLK